MKKAVEKKSYAKRVELKECFTKEVANIPSFTHSENTQELENGVSITTAVIVDTESEVIEIYVSTVLQETPYTQLFTIDFSSELKNLSEKESSTFSMSANVGNLIIQALESEGVEFSQNGSYGIQSEWLKSHENDLFTISYNISESERGYLKFFKLRKDEKDEEQLVGKEGIMEMLKGVV